MLILGIDCGIKHLGVAIVQFDDWRDSIKILEKKIASSANFCETGSIHYKTIIESINKTVDNFIQIKYLDIFDLIPGKKLKETNAIERACRLKAVLEYIDFICYQLYNKNQPDLVLVEFQMGQNNKSNDNFSQILFHYAKADNNFSHHNNYMQTRTTKLQEQQNTKLIVVRPSIKNTVSITPNGQYHHFLKRYKTRYTANKAHAVFNLQAFCTLFNQTHLIPSSTSTTKKRSKKICLKDAADAFMMIFGYIIHEKL